MTTILDTAILEKVAHAGELLIQAAAAIGTLTPEQQLALRTATGGDLPDGLNYCIRGAKCISPQIRESLRTHPPKGLIPISTIRR